MPLNKYFDVQRVENWPGILPYRRLAKDWWRWKPASPFIPTAAAAILGSLLYYCSGFGGTAALPFHATHYYSLLLTITTRFYFYYSPLLTDTTHYHSTPPGFAGQVQLPESDQVQFYSYIMNEDFWKSGHVHEQLNSLYMVLWTKTSVFWGTSNWNEQNRNQDKLMWAPV